MQTIDGVVEFRFLMETVLETAVLSGVPPAHSVQPAAVTTNPVRASTVESEIIVARARTLNSGPRFTLAEVLVEDGMGRAVAHGTGTYLVRPIEPAPPPYQGAEAPLEPPLYATPHPFQRPLAWSRRDLPEEMSYLETFRAIIDGNLPQLPVHELFGIHIVDASEGAVVGTMDASPWLCLRTADVAPGAIVVLASHFLGGALATMVPLGHRFGILDQTVSFLEAVPADGRELVVRAAVTHRRDSFLIVRAEVTDAGGSVVAVGHQTALVSPPRERARPATAPDRVLATVLFTDIVGSTRRAEELGDARWRELLDEHHAVVRRQLGLWKGREVKTTGDGFLATFDSPGRAVQCARAVRDGLRQLGLEVRVGLHTGECEVSGADVAGIAVHLASRVQAMAAPGEVLLSWTVHDLVAGSGLRFADRGRHDLKGLDGQWQLFALEGE
jgi:class 3 adenylate cyclase